MVRVRVGFLQAIWMWLREWVWVQFYGRGKSDRARGSGRAHHADYWRRTVSGSSLPATCLANRHLSAQLILNKQVLDQHANLCDDYSGDFNLEVTGAARVAGGVPPVFRTVRLALRNPQLC